MTVTGLRVKISNMFGPSRSELVIKPNEGMGAVQFLTSMDHVRTCLGNPDEIDENPELEGLSKTWHYRKLDVDLLFTCLEYSETTKGPARPLRLTVFTSSNRRHTLWDKKIMGRSELEVTELLQAHGHQNLKIKMSHGFKTIRVAELNMNFTFYRTKLDSVQWSAPIEKF